MPLPLPEKEESQKDFINRCTNNPNVIKEYKHSHQRVAVCHSQWRKAKGTKKLKEKDKSEGANMKSELIRGNISRGIENGKSGVDRENEIIHGFSVITKGEAEGHGWESDDTTLEQVVELGNALTMGVKARFGHPNMSNTALGTFLGRAKNFRKDGNITRADLHFSKTAHDTPNGDLSGYVMDLAEDDPSAFGSSIVLLVEQKPRTNEDGTPMVDKETGEKLLPVGRVKKLHGADIVDTPAANASMLGESFFSDSVKPSAEMTKFLDKFLLDDSAVEKTIDFLKRYSVVKGEKKEDKLANPGEGGSWKYCVCDKCGISEEHTAGAPCGKCPECGEQMHGANEKPVKAAEEIPAEKVEAKVKTKEIPAVVKEVDSGVKAELKDKGGEMEKERLETVEKKTDTLLEENIKLKVEKFMGANESKILPTYRPLLEALLTKTAASEELVVKFKEEDVDKELSVHQAIEQLISRMKDAVPLKEIAKKGTGSLDRETAEFEKVTKYAKENKLSFEEADTELRKQGKLV